MLYKLEKKDGEFIKIEPLPFEGVSKEKHLENLIAENLLDVLFENNALMPIFQERVWQEEADILALDKNGDLVIFELKRGEAPESTTHQILRYCEKAKDFSYEKLESMYREYKKRRSQKDYVEADLQNDHKESFDLEHPIDKATFNKNQKMVIVAQAGNSAVIKNVDYWLSKGMQIDLIPYRIYKMQDAKSVQGDYYFEFFSKPFDEHSNPKDRRGFIFDTCSSHIPDFDKCVGYMRKNNRVVAYGDQTHVVDILKKGDSVLLYHKRFGVIAYGKISSGKSKKGNTSDGEIQYHDVDWLIAPPENEALLGERALSPNEIKKILGHGFFWARTIKYPYLSVEESNKLYEALRKLR